MGNFLNELGKVFVRSAVNQVGRDGGKVISNCIYGDAHSTPIRRIVKNGNGEFFNEETEEVVNPEELRRIAEEEGFKPQYRRPLSIYILFSVFFWFIATATYPFSIIAFIYLYYRGIKKCFKKTVTLKKKGYIATYTSDRRYNTVRRYTGSSMQEYTMEVPRIECDKKHLIKVCICWMISATLILFATDIMWNKVQEDTKVRKEKLEKENEEFNKYIDSIKESHAARK